MRIPSFSAGNGTLLDLGWYAVCAVEADSPEPKLEAELETAVSNVRSAMGAQNHAKDDLTRRRARRGVARRKVGGWLRQVGLDARAVFGGKIQTLGYQKILAKSPSEIMSRGAAERLALVGKVLAALESADAPPALAAKAPEGKQLWQALSLAEQSVTEGENLLAGCGHDIAVVRGQWFAAYKSLHGKLVARFPLDRDIVDSYFDDPPSAKKSPVAVASAPASEKDKAEPA